MELNERAANGIMDRRVFERRADGRKPAVNPQKHWADSADEDSASMSGFRNWGEGPLRR